MKRLSLFTHDGIHWLPKNGKKVPWKSMVCLCVFSSRQVWNNLRVSRLRQFLPLCELFSPWGTFSNALIYVIRLARYVKLVIWICGLFYLKEKLLLLPTIVVFIIILWCICSMCKILSPNECKPIWYWMLNIWQFVLKVLTAHLWLSHWISIRFKC